MLAYLWRQLTMVRNARDYGQANPDPSAGFAAAQARLDEGIVRADNLVAQQRTGLNAVQAANKKKKKAIAVLMHPILDHLVQVAVLASKEVPDLARTFQLPRNDGTYSAFRNAAGSMATEARAHQELLVRYGLAESLLVSLEQALVQLDEATAQAAAARRDHVGATAQLKSVVQELVQVVNVMDGLNRFRFAEDAEKLAAWVSASNVAQPARKKAEEPAPDTTGTTPPAGDTNHPAA